MVLKQVYKETKSILSKVENHLNPFNKGKVYSLASRIACQLGKHNDAIELSKKYAKIKNTDSANLSLAANLLYLKKDVEANEVFRKVDLRDIDKVLLALWYWLKGDEKLARSNLEEYPDNVEREKAWRIIRNDEILPCDMWKEARKQKWFVELIGPLTTGYSNVATYHYNLGAEWNAKGKYDKAIEYYEKALKSDLKVFGEDHPDVATYRSNLGEAWKAKGEYDKAIEYYEMALKSDIKTFGENHPRVAIRWNNLGEVWRAKGEYDKAIEYYEKALKSDLKTFGENHPNVATYGNNLGTALHANGEYDKAIEYLEKAFSDIQVRLGNDHPYTKTLKANISLAKKKSRR